MQSISYQMVFIVEQGFPPPTRGEARYPAGVGCLLIVGVFCQSMSDAIGLKEQRGSMAPDLEHIAKSINNLGKTLPSG